MLILLYELRHSGPNINSLDPDQGLHSLKNLLLKLYNIIGHLTSFALRPSLHAPCTLWGYAICTAMFMGVRIGVAWFYRVKLHLRG